MQCQTFTLRPNNAQDLEQLNRFLACAMPVQVSSSLVQGNPPFWSILVFYEGEPLQPRPEVKSKPKPSKPVNPDQTYETLRKWRAEKAKQAGVPPYVIAHNAELEALAKLRPKTLDDLSIKGFGKAKIDKYGQELLELLSKEGV
jgi:superfamily II DNA helicase RecQ